MSGAEAGPDAAGAGESRRSRTTLIAGALVLLVQAGLMLGAFIPAPHTGGDNAGYLGLAYSLLERGAYLDLYLPGEPIHTKYPPGFPLLLAGARLLGAESWIAFKAVAAGAASLSVLFTFLWVRERRGLVFGGLVAVLVAASSAVVYYSHWILSDIPFLALTLLALWTLERADTGSAATRGAGDDGPDGSGRATGGTTAWLWVGCGAAIAAYFTRSAGLPLVVAVGGWLGLRRRWKGLGAFGAVFGVPAFLWWLRARGRADGYLSEFLLVDPYQPELGRAGPVDMVGRVGANAWGYVSRHVPGGITGLEGPAAAVLGVALFGLAAWGWWLRARQGREGLGVAELFLPLYAGLVLLWPEVWSGDRFALPLLPLALYFAGAAAVDLAGRIHARGAVAAGALGLLFLGGPALASWSEDARAASSCMGISRSRGAWSCTGQGMSEFVSAAGWSGVNLPEGSVVISRKPRFFYLLSGFKSEMFPLSREPSAFFSEASRLGARYLLLDRLDGLAGYYLVPVIRSRPQAFCAVSGFGSDGQTGSQLLGLVDPGSGADGGGDARLAACPPGMVPAEPRPAPDYSSSIPLFSRTAS